MTCIALRPPSHAEEDLLVLKRRLFKALGTPSALAMGPLIPLAFLETIPAEVKPPVIDFPLTTGGWERAEDGAVFLSVPLNFEEEWGRTSVKRPFKPFSGFYICMEEKNAFTDITAVLGDAPAMRLGLVYLEIYTMEIRDKGDWWRRVTTHLVRREKLRG